MDADALIRAQVELHNRLARAFDNYKKIGAAKATRGVIKARIQLIDSYWDKFQRNDESLRASHWGAVEKHEYVTKDFAAATEEIYLQMRGTFDDLLDTTRSAPALDESGPGVAVQNVSRTSLPCITLPTFSGRFEDWPSFRDLFMSIVGRDQSLSAVERLHYLKTSVRGEAEQLIRCFATIDENFNRAWATLSEHYENRRLLVNSYYQAFLTLPRMKGESAGDLRRVYHGMTAAVGSLDGIGRSVIGSPDLFVHIVVSLLDPRTRREWELAIGGTSEPPSYETLRKFLETRLQMLVAMSPGGVGVAVARHIEGAPRSVRTHHAQRNVKAEHCALCSKGHFLLFCNAYLKRQPLERRRVVESAGLCHNCLGRHTVSECRSSRTCSSCNLRHNSTLHEAFVEGAPGTTVAAVSAHVVRRLRPAPGRVLLATARVLIKDGQGVSHPARALVDPALETSLVAESLVQRLRLARVRVSVSIGGVGGKHADPARGLVRLDVVSRCRDAQLKVEALILPRITNYGCRAEIAGATWPHLQGLMLADPDSGAGDPIELLLGADVFPAILLAGTRSAGPQAPVAQETSLGWILTGAAERQESGSTLSVHVCSVESDLLKQVRAFWEQEELPPSPRPLSVEERRCEEYFTRTVMRDADGRYTVRLPVTNDMPNFSASRRAAAGALRGMERRFRTDAELQRLYTAFMREYASLGHMRPVQPPTGPHPATCFLPHHGVLKVRDAGSKLRVVFNGSCRLPSGDTLNRHLLVGPNLVPLLADVLLRWRQHRFVFVTDIEKMYRQVRVHEDDRRFQRILWRESDRTDIQEFALSTVTYGLACAPYLAVRVLQQLAGDEGSRFPKGALALARDAYVDDILSGADSLPEAVELRDQLSQLCVAGGFPLRKWAANSKALLEGVPKDHQAGQAAVTWEGRECHSTLGLQWHGGDDYFCYRITTWAEGPVTRRAVLSRTAGLYDPLGWLAPVIVRAKIFVQRTWLLQLEWDDPLGAAQAEEWRTFERALPVLGEVRVSRWLGTAATVGQRIELHGFADASEQAYAAVVYVRVVHEGRGAEVTLALAKTRVAPLRQISLPRLELCAAVMLVRLVSHTRRILTLTAAPVYLWSDSTVALGWIRGHPARWTTFVANRVAEVQQLLPDARWRHVASGDNPADCASRGLAPRDLMAHSLWWSGPDFLTSGTIPSCVDPESSSDDLPEQRRVVHSVSATQENELLARFSSWHRLVRVTAWLLRWRWDATTRMRGPLAPEELQRARARWITLEQAAAYPAELAALRSWTTLPARSSLLALSPTCDGVSVLRVGGRLQRSAIGDDARHPIILSPRSRVTGLIIEAFHRRALHGGPQLTHALLRQQFWIPRGRLLVRQAIHRCAICARWRAATPQPLMGELPHSRVTPSRPFTFTGVDYAGPVYVRTAKGRGHKAQKAFLCVFVCLSSRAIHLEVASDYTSDAFLAALRRSVSRRGMCRELWSDCGTNFVGADAQLRALFRAAGREAAHIADQLATEGVRWRFNPPAAPHFGGI
ncbi:uncharacterized protein LOC116853661 [Odontomachus brunneus]|uniref:uncharacterized protein LOC116853661 n=1 Tax=Odontomachus brunneus TaxID=486640 RepID=UPI0013F2AB8A|nr:uncharacterized protein LOC116853661 [Odontomachus brunneus]